MRALRIITLLAAGCGAVETPATDDPLASLTVVEPPRADEALALVVSAYESEIGIALPPVHVTWVLERIPFDDTTVIGLHRGCDDIWLTWWEGPRFSSLALAHEVGHCARAALGLDTDPGHLDDAWWAKNGAGIVDRVARQLAGAGL